MLITPTGFPLLRRRFAGCWTPVNILSGSFPSASSFWPAPLSRSMIYEWGLLIEAFDYPPAVGMTYTPPYYLRLIESCGLTKEKDLPAFLIDGAYLLPELMV